MLKIWDKLIQKVMNDSELSGPVFLRAVKINTYTPLKQWYIILVLGFMD